MNHYILLFLKGVAMGIANVIPGVSGGTIALLTNIYEDLIHSLKSFNSIALKKLVSFDISGFIQHTNLYFLLTVFGGSIVSVFSIAHLFEYLFENYPTSVWAFFFGLILASVFFIGKRINKWNNINFLIFLFGAIIAVSLSLINPSSENNNLFFVFICGIVGISGMMLPGLSGSFILILMGNYELLFVKAIADLNLTLLSIFFIGSLFGLVSFSHILDWIFKYYKNAVLALLTGFILGSLRTIWPWKRFIEESSIPYNCYIPEDINMQIVIAFTLMLSGVIAVWLLEKLAKK